ncbi:MAG: BamA/TamA family outer membrane protein [Nonlabens sp.]
MNQRLLLIILLISTQIVAQRVTVKIQYDDSIKAATQHLPTKIISTTGANLQARLDSLTNILEKKGYFYHLIHKPEKINDSLYLNRIALGQKFSVINLFPDEESKLQFENTLSRKRYYPQPIESLDSLLTSVNLQLANEGYPFNSIALKEVQPQNDDTLKARLVIKTGSRRSINNIIVKGYEKFPLQVVRSAVQGEKIFNNSSVQKISDVIGNLNFVKSTRSPEVLFKRDSTNLYLYLERTSSNSAEGMLGFNNAAGGGLELNGFLDINLNNNLNKAEQLRINYRNENEDQTSLDINLKIPYLVAGRYGLEGSLAIQRRDSTYQNTSYNLGISYKPGWKNTVTVAYAHTESTALENAAIQELDVISDGVRLKYDYLKMDKDDRLMPEDLSINAVLGLDNRQLGIENSINRTVAILNVEKLWRLDPRNSLLNTIDSKFVEDDDLEFSELYQFGGTNSVRGFNQNSIDASFYLTLSNTYRYRLGGNIYGFATLDGGVFKDFLSDKLRNLYSFGAGVGILTQAGIINISIANGQFESANLDLASTVAHINLRILF